MMGQQKQATVIVNKQVFYLLIKPHLLEHALNIRDEAFCQQVNTGYLIFVFYPQVVSFVKIQLIATFVIGQLINVFCTRINMIKGRAVIEIDMTDRADNHTTGFGTDNHLCAIIRQSL